MSEVLRVERDRAVARVTLNRPEVRNAFNAELIAELHAAFDEFAKESPMSLRAVVLAGEGKAFCAGADIEWQRGSIRLSLEDNEADAGRLQEMLGAIDECPVPSISCSRPASASLSAIERRIEARCHSMSAPAQKAFPSPASTTARKLVGDSFANPSKAACSSAISSALNALRTSGRLRVTRVTARSRSTRRTSLTRGPGCRTDR